MTSVPEASTSKGNLSTTEESHSKSKSGNDQSKFKNGIVKRPTSFKNILSQQYEYYDIQTIITPKNTDSNKPKKKDIFSTMMSNRINQSRWIAQYRSMDRLKQLDEDGEILFNKEQMRKNRRPSVNTSDAFEFLMTNRGEPEEKVRKKKVSFSKYVSRIKLHDQREQCTGHDIPDIIYHEEVDDHLQALINDYEDINFKELFKKEIEECVIPIVDNTPPVKPPQKDIIPLRRPGIVGKLLPIPVLAKMARKAKLEKLKQPRISAFLKKSKSHDSDAKTSKCQPIKPEDCSDSSLQSLSTTSEDSYSSSSTKLYLEESSIDNETVDGEKDKPRVILNYNDKCVPAACMIDETVDMPMSKSTDENQLRNASICEGNGKNSPINMESNNNQEVKKDVLASAKLRRSSRTIKKPEYLTYCEDSNDGADNCYQNKENITKNIRPNPMPKNKVRRCNSEDFDLKVISLAKEKTPTRNAQWASIFMKKSEKAIDPPISPLKLKARQDFLFAVTDFEDVSQKSVEEELPWPPFPAVSHVRQVSKDPIWHLQDPLLKLQEETITSCPSICGFNLIEDFPMPDKCDLKNPLIKPSAMYHILVHLKNKNSSFDVISNFQIYNKSKKESVDSFEKDIEQEKDEICILAPENEVSGKRKSKLKLPKNKKQKLDEPEALSSWMKWDPMLWTQLFAPNSSKLFIGNEYFVLQMKTWLDEWKRKCESDDVYDAYGSNSSSCDDDQLVNTVILMGSPGIGKTSLVYAFAQELGFKVLEINASSRRNGKQVLNQLSEATQSHSVSGVDNSFGKQTECYNQKTGKHTKGKDTKGDMENRKNMALILFEDIDVVFDEYDDGFLSAVNQLMTTTKRPMILTCSNPTQLLLSKIKGDPLIIHLNPPDPKVIAQYLQLMCLSNGTFASVTELESLVKFNRSDIRKTIHDLQFWSLSGTTKVQWLKMEKQKTIEESEMIKSIVQCNSVKRWSETPISSLWFSHYFENIRSNMYLNSSQAVPIHWNHIDMNIPILFPFSLEPLVKMSPLYPVSSEHVLVKNALLKYNWLDDDQSQPDDLIIPYKHNPIGIECVKKLSNLYNVLSDLDILDNQDDTHSRVQDVHCHLRKHIIDDISYLSYKHTKKHIENIVQSSSVDIDSDLCSPVTNLMEYNQINEIDNINNQIKDCTPYWTRVSRVSHSNDYLPYIRQIIRHDEINRIAQKSRRNKRYLSQLSQLGYYLSPDDCIKAANMFS